MGFFEFASLVVVFGCGSGVIVTVVNRIFGNQGKANAAELRAAQDRIRSLEAQLVDAHRQSDMLQKQLEWHTKMLETQDRLMKQLTDGQARPNVGSVS